MLSYVADTDRPRNSLLGHVSFRLHYCPLDNWRTEDQRGKLGCDTFVAGTHVSPSESYLFGACTHRGTRMVAAP